MTVPDVDALAAEMGQHLPFSIELDPAEALGLIGQVHLAMRHPSNVGPTVDAVRAVVDRIVEAYAAGGPADQFRALVRLGELPEHDLDRELTLVPDVVVDAFSGQLRPRGSDDKLGGLVPVVVDERMPSDTIAVVAGDPAHPDRGGDAVVRYVAGVDPADPDGDGDASLVVVGPEASTVHRDGIVRPVGLVWSGIRVDELPGLYTIAGPDSPDCPPLEDGEIYGEPITGRIFVWSLADFDRLVQLSRLLHDHRRGRLPGADPNEVIALRSALMLVGSDAEAIEIVRALPAGSS